MIVVSKPVKVAWEYHEGHDGHKEHKGEPVQSAPLIR